MSDQNVYNNQPTVVDENQQQIVVQQQDEQQAKQMKRNKIINIVSIALIVILLPLLLLNITLIIKGAVNPESPPSIFGIAPLSVGSGSMDGDRSDSFPEGALIFVKVLNQDQIQQLADGDVICYKSADDVYVTHRIVSRNVVDGKLVSVVTMGDANNSADSSVKVEQILGKCVGHINFVGEFALFLQSPLGIVLCVGVPVLVFIAYDVLRIYLANKKAQQPATQQALEDKDAEIARLRQMLAQQSANQTNSDEDDSTQDSSNNQQ